MAIWYILLLFGKYFPILVCCVQKRLAALITGISYLRFSPLCLQKY
jgi:hypothetical protein